MSSVHNGSYVDDLVELGHCFESLRNRPVLRRVDPPRGSLTLNNLFQIEGLRKPGEELAKAFEILELRRDIALCPIIGVVGELNAGKSSVVAMFLSEEDRRRVPRGLEDSKGTHRFVYWVPRSWRDSALIWGEFQAMLARAHGSQSHWLLPESPEEAAEVYASGEKDPALFAIPVVAVARALDSLGVALLDCPDVQTEESKEWKQRGKTRLDFLEEASRLCSAVLFICEPAHVRAATIRGAFHRIKKATEGVPLYLLINRLSAHKEVWKMLAGLNALREMVEQSEGVYVAYDFDHSGWQNLVPSKIKEESIAYRTHQEPCGDGDPLPVFFSVPRDIILAGGALGNSRDRLDSCTQSLESLPKSLGPGQIQQQAREQTAKSVLRHVRQFEDAIGNWITQRRQRAAALRESLLRVLQKATRDREGKPKGAISGKLLVEFNEAMWRTAPWWARPLMWVNKTIRKRSATIGEIIRSAKSILSLVRNMKLRLPLRSRQEAFLNVEDLAEQMVDLRWVPESVNKLELLKEAWSGVLKGLSRVESHIQHDKQELDRLASDAWSRLPVKQKAMIAAAGFGAPVCLLLAAVDGGLTVLGTLTAVSGHLPGTIICAGGLAFGALGPIAAPALKDTKLYFTGAFWAACDVFGVARLEDAPPTVELGEERFTLQPPAQIGLAEPLDVFCELDPLAGVYEPTPDIQFLFERAQQIGGRIR
ncbi:MAG: hypothetical protein KatS3mg110_0484 [Pirellulaceae bacterium]|nr:MAG: hypothetical protein KatS3mg110_0474 [Pirellulaceae bacterium]GIW92443.1 MAG: hypothetical protein KatS3mg110_0484 [Pirellulaceae bacterium]